MPASWRSAVATTAIAVLTCSVSACSVHSTFSSNYEVSAPLEPKIDRLIASLNESALPNSRPLRRHHFALFGEALEKTLEHYVDVLAPDDLVDAAIAGIGKIDLSSATITEANDAAISSMIASLDSPSSYLDSELAEEYFGTRADFGGIGIEIKSNNGAIEVVRAIGDGSAQSTGIATGDVLLNVDGVVVHDVPLRRVVAWLRGPMGSTVKIRLLRAGANTPIDLVLTRGLVQVPLVDEARLVSGKYAYIRPGQFGRTVARRIREAIEHLERMPDVRVSGIILDLRSNSGGLLDESCKIADLFLDSGLILEITARGDSRIERFPATDETPFRTQPLAVLINADTSSGAEIIAGAVQVYRRGRIIGSRSAGVYTVQSFVPLKFRSALKLATARMILADGYDFADGILPDEVIAVNATRPHVDLAMERAVVVLDSQHNN